MRDLYEFLFEIKKRPAMYIGGNSIYRLESFIDGYFFARTELGIEPTADEVDFENFHNWIQERLNLRTTKSWSSMILFCSFDEKDALEYFFDLLKEFIDRDKESTGKAQKDEEFFSESSDSRDVVE